MGADRHVEVLDAGSDLTEDSKSLWGRRDAVAEREGFRPVRLNSRELRTI